MTTVTASDLTTLGRFCSWNVVVDPAGNVWAQSAADHAADLYPLDFLNHRDELVPISVAVTGERGWRGWTPFDRRDLEGWREAISALLRHRRIRLASTD